MPLAFSGPAVQVIQDYENRIFPTPRIEVRVPDPNGVEKLIVIRENPPKVRVFGGECIVCQMDPHDGSILSDEVAVSRLKVDSVIAFLAGYPTGQQIYAGDTDRIAEHLPSNLQEVLRQIIRPLDASC